MAGSVRIELNSDGIKELLNCPGVAGECRNAAGKVAAAAGENFTVSDELHPGSRVLFLVYPANGEGAKEEAEDKVLSRAVSQCR